jgi:chromosome segregation ATPase
MNEKLQNALLELELSLQDIDSAAKMIEGTNESAKEVIQNTSKLIRSVRDKNLELQKYADTWFKELDNKTNALFVKYQDIWEEHNEMVDTLVEQHNDLSIKTEKLVHYLNSVNFPARLDKIDSTIASISASIQNLSGQINDVKRDLSEKIVDQISKINERIEKNDTPNKARFIITAIALGLILVAFLYFYIS